MPKDGKTEKASDKKKKDERKKGNIFQSKDITSSLGLIGIFVFLRIIGPFLFSYIKKITIDYLNMTLQFKSLNIKEASGFFTDVTIKTLITALPIVLAAAFFGTIINAAQTRFNFSMSQLKIKLSRINPIEGFKKIISLKSIVELIKSIIKIIILAEILYLEISANLVTVLSISDKDISETLMWLGNLIFWIVIKVCLAMFVFGIFDYFYQWWNYEHELRMSKQDVKDEFKQVEGDPQLKGRIREIQRKMAAKRMMQNVPTADVIIRNPTHYAVAIKYDPEIDRSPKVIAKGQGYVALKIIEIAEEHKITITENRPLARGLYEAVDIDGEIPSQFYQAVAEVLAFIYNLKKRKRVKR
jgi:flagellar biosynthetic protein FlhB